MKAKERTPSTPSHEKAALFIVTYLTVCKKANSSLTVFRFQRYNTPDPRNDGEHVSPSPAIRENADGASIWAAVEIPPPDRRRFAPVTARHQGVCLKGRATWPIGHEKRILPEENRQQGWNRGRRTCFHARPFILHDGTGVLFCPSLIRSKPLAGLRRGKAK